MSDQAQQPETQNPQPDTAASVETKPTKTYTEDELSAIVASRLSKQKKSLSQTMRDELKQELDEERKAAELPEIERLQKEAERAKADRDSLEATLRQTRDELALTGKVTNVKLALRALEDAHRKDGDIDLGALFKDYPDLKPGEPQPERLTVTPQAASREAAPNMPADEAAYQRKLLDRKYQI